jgi:hypothetical protein
MAQTIKIKRGGYGAIASLTGTNAGELALVTGSAGSISNFPTPFSVLLANDGANWRVPLGGIVTGSGVPGTPSNARFNGILYYDTTGNQFYRLSNTGNQQLDVAATVQNVLTAGNGLFANGVPGGTFNGSSAVTFSINSASININHLGSTPLTVAKGGTGLATIASGQVLIGNGTGAVTTRAIGIADTNIVKIDQTGVADDDYAKFTANGLEGRSYSEVKTDLSLNNVENTALSTWPGSTNITTLGTVTTGNVKAILPSGIVSASILSSPNQGSAVLITNGVSGSTIDLGLQTGDSPAFTGLSLTGLQNQAAEATAVVINGTTIGTRELGSNAFTSTTIGTTTAALTQGAGIQSFTFNGSAAQTVALEAAQTTITSVKNDSLVVGRTTGNDIIDFGTAGSVIIKTDNTARVTVTDTGTTIAGNLTVSGTTTTVNSQTVNILDNIINLNYGGTAEYGGITVRDVTGGNTATGSLLWNGTTDYWSAGTTAPNGTHTHKRIPLQDADMANNSFVIATGAGTINDITPSTAGDILQYNGSSLVASNVIDGGTF